MPDLDTEARASLRDSAFAYVDHDGERHLPIHDVEHVRNAIARFGRTAFESEKARHAAATRIVAAARRFDVVVDRESDVARVARS